MHAVQLAGELEKRFEVKGCPRARYMRWPFAGRCKIRDARAVPERGLGRSADCLLDHLVRGMSEEMDIAFTEDEEIYNALQAHLGTHCIPAAS